MIFSGWLIACDIDGTLMTNGRIPKRNIEKIEYFVEHGGMFSLCTGRTPGAVSTVTEKINCFSPSVMGNGTMIYDFKSRKLLYNTILTDDIKNLALEIYKRMPHIGMEIHSGDRVFVSRRSESTDIHERYEKMEVSFVSMEEALKFPWTKVLAPMDSGDDIEKIAKIAEELKIYSKRLNTSAMIDGKVYNYLELVPEGTSKATALLELARLFSIDKNKICAIGDYYNDIEMLKCAKLSACPDDSPEDIKSICDCVFSPCDEGAVADLIDYIETQIRKEAENGR